MKALRRGRAPIVPKRAKNPQALRLNGVEHWQRTLERLLWMLLRAGIDPRQITLKTGQIVKAHRNIRTLRIPPPEVLEYARVLTYWRNEPQFLDEQGVPRSLPLTGGASSFRTLLRKALPGSVVEDVLRVLRRHQLITVGSNGRVTLRASAFLPRNERRAQFLAYTLSAIEGIVDTCHRNLTARESADSIGRLQRVASAERFDVRFIKDYDLFLRDQGNDFLLKQDAWLKRHEVKSRSAGKMRVAQVGVGVFGFRTH